MKRGSGYRWLMIGTAVLISMVLGVAQTPNAYPYTYFAGHAAATRYAVDINCNSSALTLTYIRLTSGPDPNGGNPSRWAAAAFDLCEETSFDTLSLALATSTTAPYLYVMIVGATYDSNGDPIPDLNAVFFPLTAYPISTVFANNQQELSYLGGTPSLMVRNTFELGQRLTLPAGRYFLIAYGDDGNGTAGTHVSHMRGVPGGPKLYYTARRQADGSWEKFRTSVADYNCRQVLNVNLPFREADPFGDPSDTSPLQWRTYHSPYLYNIYLGLRDSQAASGSLTGTVQLSDWAGSTDAPLRTVEVIFYLPGTNARVARFSMPAPSSPNTTVAINTPAIKAGTYDVVIRPIYAPANFIRGNCPSNACVTGITMGITPWLSVRIPNVSVTGTVDIGTITLPTGDVNGDLTVDDADLLQVLFAFGSSDASTDPNGDGTVDDADLLLVLFNFGASGESGDEACGGD